MQIFNSLGRSVETFEPAGGRVGMYVCGPTVQSEPHIGHGRQAVAFDVVRRYLAWRGFDVTYVANITDVEDKIIAAANEEGVSIEEIVERASGAFLGAYARLNVLDPDFQPRATEHITEMIDLVERLVAGGHAYEADGDVYFSVRSFEGYGKLSGRDVDELQSGARVQPGEAKRDPLDFALWKSAKPGEPSWPSPWGPGRPGWHIECSAMSEKYLGFGFDIHGGGQDLVFPHHENEIAQSEAAQGRAPFARVWMHNGMVNLGGQKMSKSTGHLVLLHEALDRYAPLAIRFFYLRTHYRRPVDFTEEAMDDATAALERLWAFRRRFGPAGGEPEPASLQRFAAVVDDDFDVPGGLGVLFEVVREGNKRLDAGEDAGPWVAAYDEIMGVLGVAEPADDLGDVAGEVLALAGRHSVTAGGPIEAVEGLLVARGAARDARDWTTADAVRDGLAAVGIVVEDTPDGARWHRA